MIQHLIWYFLIQANSLTVMPLPRWSLTVARVRSSWPSIFQSCFRNQAKTLKKPNLRTLSTSAWLSSNTLKTRTYSRSSTARCWPKDWFSTCRHQMMLRHLWSPSWNKLVVSSIRANFRECSRTLAWARIWTKILSDTLQILESPWTSTSQFKFYPVEAGRSSNLVFLTFQLSWRDVLQGHLIDPPFVVQGIIKCFCRFTAFYSGQHSGRKLNWLFHMSKGELVTNCFKNKYTLQVFVDLLIFNGGWAVLETLDWLID